MLVIIDNEIIDYYDGLASEGEKTKIEDQLDRIADASKWNKIILFDIGNTLIQISTRISLHNKSEFVFAHDNRRELMPLYKMVNRVIRITKSTLKKNTIINERIEYCIPILSDIDIGNSVKNIHLLSENTSDASFYICFADMLARKNCFPLRSQFHKRGGGGSTIASELENCISSYFPTLCVVDSDCAWRGKAAGSTYRAVSKKLKCANVRKVINESFPIMEFYFNKNYREIENLIPSRYLVDYFTNNRTTKMVTLFQKLISNDLCFDNSLYFDIKKGIKKKDYQNYPDKIKELIQTVFEFDHTEILKKEDNEILIPGFGDNVIDQVIEKLGVNCLPEYGDNCPKYKYLYELSIIVFSWGCVRTEKRYA